MRTQGPASRAKPLWTNWLSHHPFKVKAAGSNPAGGTTLYRLFDRILYRFHAPVDERLKSSLSQGEGCGFKSHRGYQAVSGVIYGLRIGKNSRHKSRDNPIRNPPSILAPVAQLEEARGLEPRQWGFDSLPEYQLLGRSSGGLEHPSDTRKAAGSSPAVPTVAVA